jgi:hypothetical protein
MPHIVGHEGEKPEHDSRGKAVPDDIAYIAIPASKIDGQDDGNRQGGGDAGEPGHQHSEPAVRPVIGENAGTVGHRLEKRAHGLAGEFGGMGYALQDRGRKVHRNHLAVR